MESKKWMENPNQLFGMPTELIRSEFPLIIFFSAIRKVLETALVRRLNFLERSSLEMRFGLSKYPRSKANFNTRFCSEPRALGTDNFLISDIL